MSRIGKKTIDIPSGVSLTETNGTITAKGPKGSLDFVLPGEIEPVLDGAVFSLRPRSESKRARSMWGTARTRVANLIVGVTQGFEKSLELVGVGYRAQMKGTDLNLQLGFSHDVLYKTPEGVKIETPKPTEVKVSGIDKQLVGQTAAEIRAFRPPEPYKGKGVRYADEIVLRKEGKKK